jgi:ketosteroid isomerase-like protein
MARNLAAWALLAFLLLLATACNRTPPEQALRETIAKMQAAGEARDVDALFDPIAEDFAGSEGMDRQAFRRYVTLMSMQNKSVGVTLGPIDVKLYGDRATASFTAAIRGGPGLLPDQAQVYAIETGWRLEDGDWKLISATWKPQL